MDDLAAQNDSMSLRAQERTPDDLPAQCDTMSLRAVCAKQSPSDAGRLLRCARNDIMTADSAQERTPDDPPAPPMEVRPEDLQQDVALLRQNFRLAAEVTLARCDAADYPRLLNTLANVAGKLAQLVRVQIELQVSQSLGTQGLGAQGHNPTDPFKGLSAEVLAEIQRETSYMQLIMRLPDPQLEPNPEG